MEVSTREVTAQQCETVTIHKPGSTMYSNLSEEFSKAIGARLLVSFADEGRTHAVELHLPGHSIGYTACLRAWRTGTAEQAEPGWGYYQLSRMQHTKLLDLRFSKERPGYAPYGSTMN